jgi:DNA-binding response OmpR family regulator
LDINLPDGNGFELYSELKEKSTASIIFLTANDLENDIVKGFDLGADDYITKPFSPVVLQKKIAVLTKYITEKQKETIYEDGNLCINFSQMTATLDKVPLELSPLEYRILQYFIVNKKHILKRDQLLEHLWDFSENFVGDTSLNTAISRLRKKIEASGHRYIKTIYGTGYMWIGD